MERPPQIVIVDAEEGCPIFVQNCLSPREQVVFESEEMFAVNSHFMTNLTEGVKIYTDNIQLSGSGVSGYWDYMDVLLEKVEKKSKRKN